MTSPAGDEGRRPAPLAGAHRFLLARFRAHLRLYVLVCGGLTLVNLWTGAGWWSFTPVGGWGVLLAVHYFYVRAANVDDDWVRDRTDDLKVRSYDLGPHHRPGGTGRARRPRACDRRSSGTAEATMHSRRR